MSDLLTTLITASTLIFNCEYAMTRHTAIVRFAGPINPAGMELTLSHKGKFIQRWKKPDDVRYNHAADSIVLQYNTIDGGSAQLRFGSDNLPMILVLPAKDSGEKLQFDSGTCVQIVNQ